MEEGNHNRNENLAKFIEITQIPQKIAKEIMENTNWDLDVCIDICLHNIYDTFI